MAMERFLTSLVFCEAPLDAYGTSASLTTAGAIKQLVATANKPAPDAEKKRALICGESSSTAKQQRRAGFELAFDGLNCFDTVVMH